MNKVATFEKISKDQAMNDIGEIPDYFLIHDFVQLPRRATKGSAGYDFFAPFKIELKPGESVKIPTMIRCRIDEGWVLKIYPRSSLGFKYKAQLANTVGIIDSDYYNAENEGHIWIKLFNDGDKTMFIDTDEAFAQGIFVPYGITTDDNVEKVRTGGLGSTTGK